MLGTIKNQLSLKKEGKNYRNLSGRLYTGHSYHYASVHWKRMKMTDLQNLVDLGAEYLHVGEETRELLVEVARDALRCAKDA